MKILFVNAGNESGGGRTHIVNLLKGLNQKTDVTAQLLVFEKGPVSEMAQAMGLQVKIIERHSGLGINAHLKEIENYINDDEFDVVNTHGARSNLFLSRIYKKITAIWVATIHSDPRIDFNLNTIKGRIQFWLNRQAIKKARHLYLITDRFRPFLQSIGYPDDQMTPIFNAIEFTDHLKDKKIDDVFDIVMVARLVEVKNHLLALSALKQAKFSFKLHLVGDGNFENELKKYVNENGLAESVIFKGYHDDVSEYYEIADLLLLTSNTEGYPFVFLEAAQYGVPILSTDVGSVADIVTSSDMGWIIPVGNQECLLAALNESYQEFQTGVLKDKGTKFKIHIENDLTLGKLSDKMVNSYASLLKGK